VQADLSFEHSEQSKARPCPVWFGQIASHARRPPFNPFVTAEDFPPMTVTRLSLPLWKELRSHGLRVRPMPA
jgi:hypothetical protein